MKLNAIIVDDEEYSRKSLFFLMEGYCQDVKVVGIAKSVKEARDIIAAEKIDLVFLDVAMPVEDGFALLPSLRPETSVIFTTAYDTYAIKAIKASALDYLLKPIDIDDLQAAVNRATKRMGAAYSTPQSLSSYFEEDNIDIDMTNKIRLPHANGFEVVGIDDILYIEADSNYSVFTLRDGSRLVISRHLKDYESIFSEHSFCRIHKSTIINLKHLTTYSNKGGLVVTMRDKSSHTVSRRRSPGFLTNIRKNFKK